MIPSPIHKALLIFRKCNVRFLLMGGQACILYGGAEFSRDLDLSVSVDDANFEALKNALDILGAQTVFFPELSADVLRRGHACHFRCAAKGVEGLRIDIMNTMRGCADFDKLWETRAIIELPEIGKIGILSLSDLVRAKKTQREKDWPMIRRLIEADIISNGQTDDQDRIRFWLMECRTAELLIELASKHKHLCREMAASRSLLKNIENMTVDEVQLELQKEEDIEKDRDRKYWMPLKKELESWRHERKKQ